MVSSSEKTSTDTNHNVEPDPNETSTEPQKALSTFRRRTLVFTLCANVFLSALDITIIATALPTIAGQLDADAAQYVWIGSSYTLASTALSPIWGKAFEIWGGKAMLIWATLTFLGGSLLAALSKNVAMLIAGRILQGGGGGGINVLVSITIGQLFSLRDRGKYYGMTGVVWGIASAMGPVLGGVFTQTAGWRWCFYINLPVGGVILLLLIILLKIPHQKRPWAETLRSIDWIGSVLVIGGTVTFLFGLESGSSRIHSWSSGEVAGPLAGGAATMMLFVLYEWHFARNPVLPVKIFASRAPLACLGVAACNALVFIAYDYFLPLYFQAVLNLRPIIAGLAMFALVVPVSFAAAGTGFYLKKTGNFNLPTRLGLALMTVTSGLFTTFDSHVNWPKIVFFLLMAGLGAGPLFQSPLIALQTHLKPSDMAPGTSGLQFLRMLFTSMSIVVGGVLLQSGLGTDSFLSHGAHRAPLGPTEAQRYVSALRRMWIFYAVVTGIGLLIAFLIPRRPQLKDEQPEECRSSESAEGVQVVEEKRVGANEGSLA